ncbi:hypothetical protein BDU57DRAFT_528088 [Ampelomyces quisqualis]|uniref:Uncharacterized protein n=1 Tax=Ampelomyces quisqualis TaxID=50730 RepID=A0A6A5QP69_AMPQU|nr:hypothetical protein BDU57DRAFT_528088 [Ampelomyces quisqualis]
MATPRITKPHERETGSWPLPNWITKSICLRAGREASAALCIALGKHTGASAAHEATYHEPFTYWDWHGLGPDDTYAREWKRQRMWEHQRGFVVDGTKIYGYPTSRERWRKFKEDLDAHPWKKQWVKMIAVAHWMEMEDLYWVADNFTVLEGMDLSDIPAPYTDHEGFQHHRWEALLGDQENSQSESMLMLLGGLTWLGLPDICDPRGTFASNLMYRTLPRCKSLETLSIRRVYSQHNFANPNDYICGLSLNITTSAPPTLTKLELRLPFVPLDALMSSLSRLKSPIKHISFDLGAWIQISPEYQASVKVGSKSLHEPEIKRTAGKAARAMRFTTYEKLHNETCQAKDKWWLPRSEFDRYVSEEENVFGQVKHAFDRNFYCHDVQATMLPDVSNGDGDGDRGQDPICNCRLNQEGHEDGVDGHIQDARVSTVPTVLSNLCRAASKNTSFTISALKPEWQEKSTNPLHPFTLLHKLTPEEPQQTRGHTDKYLSVDQYRWLSATFNWRPVFDWDCLVNPEANNPGNSRRSVYEVAKKQFGLESLAEHEIVKNMAEQFQLLKQAGIPLHILIGRRPLDTSSLYWGWPYDENTWSQWLDTPLDVDLRTIAPLIDTLSIMYDIRNPLDEHRIHSIKSLSPSTIPLVKATCPRPLCPWTSSNSPCLFPNQWLPLFPGLRHQKMANKHLLRTSNPCLTLAPHQPSLPPPGHSVPPNTQSTLEDSLTHLARDAAFKREALAWQRFWCTYAPSLTNLSTLNVRMPRAFDVVKSATLARLLDPFKGWHVITYADEIGEDEDEDAGVFVRRTWVKKGRKGVEKISISDEGEKIAEKEMEELVKGVKIVTDAAKAERDLEKELKTKSAGKRPEGDNIPMEKRLESVYGRRIAHVAKQAWQRRVRAYVDNCTQAEIEQQDDDVRKVLGATRAILERSINVFPPADVFERNTNMKEGIGLVAHTRDYSDEEKERRDWPAPVRKIVEAVEVAATTTTDIRECPAVKMSHPIVSEIPTPLPLDVSHARSSDTRNIAPVQDTTMELHVQTPEEKDDWDPYGSGTPVAQQAASLMEAQDDVFKLLDVLREHGPSIVRGPETTTQPLSPFEGYEAATSGANTHQVCDTIKIENFEKNKLVEQHSTANTTASSYVHQTTQVEQQIQLAIPSDQTEQSRSSRHFTESKEASKPQKPSASTSSMNTTSRRRSVTSKELEPLLGRTLTLQREHMSILKELTPDPREVLQPSGELTSGPKELLPPQKELTPLGIPALSPKEPSPPPQKLTPPPKQPTPPQKPTPFPPQKPTPSKQPTPSPESPSPSAPKKRTPRKRKDPVISNNPPELETGRRLRSSRSATPAQSYKEDSEDDEDLGKKKGKAKSKGRKRAADKGWDGETGKGKKRGRK